MKNSIMTAPLHETEMSSILLIINATGCKLYIHLSEWVSFYRNQIFTRIGSIGKVHTNWIRSELELSHTHTCTHIFHFFYSFPFLFITPSFFFFFDKVQVGSEVVGNLPASVFQVLGIRSMCQHPWLLTGQILCKDSNSFFLILYFRFNRMEDSSYLDPCVTHTVLLVQICSSNSG